MSKTTTATEYYAKTRVPYAQVRRMSAGRCYDEIVTVCGREVGRKTQIMDGRGKVIQETYSVEK